ncbi:MAG: hypothetical protein ACYC2Y_06240 [Armatimonadota bacterium]
MCSTQVFWVIIVLIVVGIACAPLLAISLIYFGGWIVSRILSLLFAEPPGARRR